MVECVVHNCRDDDWIGIVDLGMCFLSRSLRERAAKVRVSAVLSMRPAFMRCSCLRMR